MNMDIFQKMGKTELKSYLQFLLWHYRVVDAFWFINVEERFDKATAELINEQVWKRAPAMAAKDLISRFDITEKRLKGFVKALKIFPWCIITEYQIQESENQVILSVPSCPAQEARLRHGLQEFVCKEMHRGLFATFAGVIDKRIRVECQFAPPDPHPKDLFCKWCFFLEGEGIDTA